MNNARFVLLLLAVGGLLVDVRLSIIALIVLQAMPRS